MIGQTLAHYRITAKLGAGGMGEVYRATDTKLGRDVALKILPEGFAQDADRMARFQREAQVLASLNHPNIAAIYGVEERALVMELVEGATLAGPLPLETALDYARQIAEALEAAHEKGIIHRDLKPANVKVTPEGVVKVLDFGLARATERTAASGDAINSPTLTIDATRAGVILGTAGYMSPEQAKGKVVDRRADIWAFGIVLMEMLTGRQMYAGETASETLAFVMTREPSFDALPAGTPASIRKLLRRCLDKDPKRRLRDMGEARIVLEDAARGEISEPQPAATPARVANARVPWLVAALALLAAVTLAVIHFREKPPATPTTRFHVLPPEKAMYTDFPTISPDGRRVAFVATIEGKQLLWVHALDSLAGQPLAGTDEATYPFWSPDSRFVAFFAQAKLKKIDVMGGPPVILCNAEAPGRGGTWTRDGTILFGAGNRSPLQRVSAAGGTPVPVTSLDSTTELSHRWPQILPDGKHFLYWLLAPITAQQGIILASLDDKPDSKQRQRLVTGTSLGAWSAGHLLFERDGTLMAARFDTSRFQFSGEPFPIVQVVGAAAGQPGWAAFSVSGEGTLAYRTGTGLKTQLTWFDRSGKELGRVGAPVEQASPRISPDQKRVAVSRSDRAQSDLWLMELARDASSRFTFNERPESVPVWSPDGSRIAFSAIRDSSLDIYLKLSTGAAEEERLLATGYPKHVSDWSPDGRFLLFSSILPKTGIDIFALPLGGDRKPIPVVQTQFNESLGQFSPDGRWIAYQSNESMPLQVYVQAFPTSGGKFQVSTSGGGRPRWRRDGKELFYLSPDRKLMAVEVKATATTFETSRPRELFQTRVVGGAPFMHTYDVSADGQRFLINSMIESEDLTPITVVMNWAPPTTNGR